MQPETKEQPNLAQTEKVLPEDQKQSQSITSYLNQTYTTPFLNQSLF